MATKKKTNNPLSRKADWTITEFQMWLAGAYSLQGENWVPNAEQWEMIVDIIYKLKNKKAEPAQVSTPVSFPAPPMQHPMPPPPMQQPMFGGSPQGSSLMGGDTDLPPEASMPLSQLRAKSGLPGNSNVLAGNGKPGEKEIKTGAFE